MLEVSQPLSTYLAFAIALFADEVFTWLASRHVETPG
jgi:hypothetical protein